MKVGSAPFTHNALMHKEVCHRLGEVGASIDMAVKLKNVQDSYGRLKCEVSI